MPQGGREEIGGLLGRRTLSVEKRVTVLLTPPLRKKSGSRLTPSPSGGGLGWGHAWHGLWAWRPWVACGHGGDPARIASRLAPIKSGDEAGVVERWPHACPHHGPPPGGICANLIIIPIQPRIDTCVDVAPHAAARLFRPSSACTHSVTAADCRRDLQACA